MSGSTRSANAVVSDWNASQTTRNGILYSPSSPLVVQHPADLRRVHRRVPCHVGHVDHQRVDRIRVAAPRVGDHVVHHPVHGERVLPRERLVDAHRRAVVVDEEILRARPASRARVRRAACRAARPAARSAAWPTAESSAETASGAGIRRAGRSCRAATSGSRARGSSGSRSNARRARASRGRRPGLPVTVACSRPHESVHAIGSSILLVARGDAHLAREAADRRRRHAGDRCRPLRRALGDALLQQLMRRLDRAPVRHRELAVEERIGAVGMRWHGPVA